MYIDKLIFKCEDLKVFFHYYYFCLLYVLKSRIRWKMLNMFENSYIKNLTLQQCIMRYFLLKPTFFPLFQNKIMQTS